MLRTFLILFVGFSISACVSPTQVVTPLGEEHKGVRNVETIEVAYGEFSKSKLVAIDLERKAEGDESDTPDELQYKSLKEAMEVIVTQHLESRDNDIGQNSHVEIEIDNLKFANAAAAILIGDTDQLAGTVRVYDTETKALLTEFYVDVLKGRAGLLGLAIRGSGVREQLSLEYADIIGDQLGFEDK